MAQVRQARAAAIAAALAAAVLFGASTPFAKALVAGVHPVMLAGLLYFASGIVLLAFWMVRSNASGTGLQRSDLPWLAGAILSGGVAGPVLLMFGLRQTPAAAASLLLNLEAVLTAVLAWFVFREHFDRRIAAGMLMIVAGGILLAWPGSEVPAAPPGGALLIAAACAAWAVDNNLTRRISAANAVFIAGTKGLAAGTVNILLAIVLGAAFPDTPRLAAAAAVGVFGYGVSLVLFVMALRALGTARTSAYFSTAPFVGAGLAIAAFGEPAPSAFWLAAALMAGGVWLHIGERHAHLHVHEPTEHTHPHVHDEHHRHEHEQDWDGLEPHAHLHRHAPIAHTHAHFPDIHHRHPHE